MAAESGKPNPELSPLVAEILAAPQRFEFFQAVRVMDDHAWRAAAAGAVPAAVFGDRQFRGTRRSADSRHQHAVLRLRSTTMLGFPGAAITSASLLEDDDEEVVECEVSCFGLVGPAGVLPRHYTTLLLERQRRFKDTTLRDFLDILENRTLSLLYGAWVKYRQFPLVERTTLRQIATAWDDGAAAARDPVSAVVACLVGLGTRGLADRLAVPDETVFYYAGHYAHQPRAAEPLEEVLSDVVRFPVRVRQFVGRWLQLEPPDQTRLASRTLPDGLNARLGGDAIAGSRVWNVQSVVELVVGPLALRSFLGLLPGSVWLGRIGDLARLYVGPTIDVRVRPLLAAGEVPPLRLLTARNDAQHPPALLGWTTWLTSGPLATDRGDAAFATP